MIVGALRWDVGTESSSSAPGSSSSEADAVSASITGSTTAGYIDAGSLSGAPCLINWADTASAVVVIERAFSGDDRALVCSETPRSAGSQGGVLTAVVMIKVTGRD